MNSLDAMLKFLVAEAGMELLLRAGNRPTVRTAKGELKAVPGSPALSPASMAALLRGTAIGRLIPKANPDGIEAQVEAGGQAWQVIVIKRGVDLQVKIRFPTAGRSRPVASPSTVSKRIQLKTPVPGDDGDVGIRNARAPNASDNHSAQGPDDARSSTRRAESAFKPQSRPRDVPIPRQPLTAGDDALSKIFGRGFKSDAASPGGSASPSATPSPQQAGPFSASREPSQGYESGTPRGRQETPERAPSPPVRAMSDRQRPPPATSGQVRPTPQQAAPHPVTTHAPAQSPAANTLADQLPLAAASRVAAPSSHPAQAPPSIAPSSRAPQRRYSTVALKPDARKQLLAAAAATPPHPHFVSCVAFARSLGASDLLLLAHRPLNVRRLGRIETHGEALPDGALERILESLITPEQSSELDERGHVRFTANLGEAGPIRLDVSLGADGLQTTVRLLPTSPLALEQLGTPKGFPQYLGTGAGLVLIVSPTGHGKSASLAGAIHHINSTRRAHILHLEASASLAHAPIQSMVTQRAIGLHCADWKDAVDAASGLDVDVVALDSLEDGNAIEAALAAASAGRLVLATMSGTSGPRAIETLLDRVPTERQHSARQLLGRNLRAVLFQRLLIDASGQRRVPACEMIVGSPVLARMVREAKMQQLPGLMQRGQGMLQLSDAVAALLESGTIDAETARPFLAEARTADRREHSAEASASSEATEGDSKSLADRVGGLFRRKK